MSRERESLFSFNRGIVSHLGLARFDVKRVALSAEIQTNYIPRVLGSMMLRPGLGYLGSTLSNLAAKFLPFIFATTDTALLELTPLVMRIWIIDTLLTRVSVSSAVSNGDFTTDLTGWTDSDEVGGVSQWVSPGYMQLAGNGTAAAIRDQMVAVAVGDRGVEHALRIVIARGPVTLRVGNALGDDSYITETILQAGTHSLAFTPTGDFFIRFLSRRIPVVWIDSCNVEAAGVTQITTPWGASDLNNIRIDQSGDIIFVACAGFQQRRISRRATHSWSVDLYVTEDGPFLLENLTAITLTPSAITGNITITSSVSLFRSTQVGTLFSITSVGQVVTKSVTAQNTFSDAIRVTGVGTDRTIAILISNTFVATVVLQGSITSSSGPWSDVAGQTWAAPVNTTYVDGLDNQIIWYRIGVKTGGYTSGTADLTLSIGSGSIKGIVRITDFTSSTSVGAEVITALGGLTASAVWEEGKWSDFRGWPTSVSLHEGRMWWAGKGGILGSISDSYYSFDETFVGDAGPINRNIGSGPVDTINWLLSLQRLVMGAQGSEFSIKSSSLDEPLTPTNFNIKTCSNQGSNAINAIKVDQNGIFVSRNGVRVYELEFNIQNYDYSSSDITALCPTLGSPGIVRCSSHRQPDTRIHFVRSDGIVICAVSDKTENVLAWIEVVSDGASGLIEDVVTLPALTGNVDDQVYYVVKRTINGSTVRYLEKWAQESECHGGTLCKLADAYVTYTGVATTTITGLSHLEGQNVVVWADGADVGTDDSTSTWTQTYTVSGGQITLAVAASNVVVGLPYTAQFKSAKLGNAQNGTPLNVEKRIKHLGLILADSHTRGIRFGKDFTHLDDMPGVERGVSIGDAVNADYDEQPIPFPGNWNTDSRLCLQSQTPRPCTVLAATMDMEVNP